MKYQTKFQFIRIYFDTVTLDRVTKDSRVKFSDMLAGVGGTMGLLTGFSIISGIEILYFAVKIILREAFRFGRVHLSVVFTTLGLEATHPPTKYGFFLKYIWTF